MDDTHPTGHIAPLLDTIDASRLIGRTVRHVSTPSMVAHIVGVITTLGGRSYTIEWMINEDLHGASFWGFQLELIE